MKKTILNNSILSEVSDERQFPIQKVFWSRTRDIKSQSYTDNRTIFDLQMQNNSYFTDFSSGYIMIPMVNTLSYNDLNSVNHKDEMNDFALTMKGSILTYLNNMTIWLNDKQINNPTQQMFYGIEFEMMKKSNEDINLLKDLIIWQKNAVESIGIDSANTVYAPATYEFNNKIDDAFKASEGSNYHANNKGRAQRLLTECQNFSRDKISVFYDNAKASENHVNYLSNTFTNTTAGTNTSHNVSLVYNYFCIVPLALLSDFFVKTSILRGFKLKIDLQGQFDYSTTVTVTNGVYSGVSTVKSGVNSVCPFMLSPVANASSETAGLCVTTPLATTVTTITISSSINSAIGTHIHLPQITYNPIYENLILKNPKKTVIWNDFVVYPSISELKNLAAGSGSVSNCLITQSIIRPRGLLLVPISKSVDGTKELQNFSSPFSSQPCTTAPYAMLKNVNLQINDINIYQANFDYGYQNYCEFVNAESNTGLNLKKNHTMTGQISKSEWERGYCYYYFDLTQYVSTIGEDDLGKSIRLTCTNGSNHEIGLVPVLFYEKEFEIDRSNGELNIKV